MQGLLARTTILLLFPIVELAWNYEIMVIMTNNEIITFGIIELC